MINYLLLCTLNSWQPISETALASAAAQEPNCAEDGPGLYEYPENCRKYYSCDVTGTLSLELCYDNWLFRFEIHDKF